MKMLKIENSTAIATAYSPSLKLKRYIPVAVLESKHTKTKNKKNTRYKK